MSRPSGPFRLITIPMSHYCEKARWGLERLGIDYHEERHLQLFHYPRTYRVSGGPNVPVLIDGERVVQDSTAILKYLDRYATANRSLYPHEPRQRARVEELEDLFDEVIGVESRRWIYFVFRNHLLRALHTAGQGVPAWEKLCMPVIYPAFRVLIRRLLEPNRVTVANGLAKIRAIVDTTDALLAQGNAYLLGDRFTAADLSLACMMAPLVLPRNYGIRLPEVGAMPESARPVVNAFRDTATGAFVLHLFATEKPDVSGAP